MKYRYRVKSKVNYSRIEPLTMTHTLEAAIDAVESHVNQLPGCSTVIEKHEAGDWKLWEEYRNGIIQP